MSLQNTLDQIHVRTRQKVDSYGHKRSRLNVESQRMNETAHSCAREARGLEQFVASCNDRFDPVTNEYKCLTSESRSAVQAEILELERVIASHPGGKAARAPSFWGSVGSKEYKDSGAFLEPFFEDAKCGDRKMYCEWHGSGTPMPLGPRMDLAYVNQKDAWLSCEAKYRGETVLFVPQNKMSKSSQDHRDARVVSWSEALSTYGSEPVYTSLLRGACDL